MYVLLIVRQSTNKSHAQQYISWWRAFCQMNDLLSIISAMHDLELIFPEGNRKDTTNIRKRFIPCITSFGFGFGVRLDASCLFWDLPGHIIINHITGVWRTDTEILSWLLWLTGVSLNSGWGNDMLCSVTHHSCPEIAGFSGRPGLPPAIIWTCPAWCERKDCKYTGN